MIRSAPRARPALLMAALLAAPAADLGAQPADEVPGIAYRQVTWEDFMGAPPDSSRVTAMISTGIYMAPLRLELTSGEDASWRAAAVAPRIRSFMNPWASGVRPGGKSDRALAHEQLHFDIAELHARRLGAAIAELEVSGSDPLKVRREAERRVWELYRTQSEQMERMEERYDRETEHGTRRRSQARWQREVARQLAAYPTAVD